MSQIGFLAQRHVKQRQNNASQTEKLIFSFDSGKALSQKDAKLHTLILGTTGTGKTASVVLPMLYGVLSANECGMIIDIKGNLREQVRHIAKAANRHEDIFEYGLSDTAIPCNIIENMTLSEYQSFLESIIDDSYDGKSNNKDFRQRGIAQCMSIHQFLQIVAKKKNEASPTLRDLFDIIMQPHKAGKFFEEFMAEYFDSDNEEEKRLVNEVNGETFHIFHYTNEDYNQHRVYHEQLNYSIDSARAALEQIFFIKNMEEKFACKNAPGVNFKENFYKNRITILRFEPGTGKVGATFSRLFVTKYYETVFSIPPKEIAAYPSFVCIDEFHDVAVLNGKEKFSDTAFVAQAREFNASFIASTQSASSLLCTEGNTPENVYSFISNCNTKLFFRSEDPLTQKLAENFAQVNLIELEPSYAYVNLYSDKERRPSFSLECVNNSFEKIQAILNNKEYLSTTEEILETNAILLQVLKRERKKALEAKRAEQAIKQQQKKEKAIRKIFDKEDPLECKIQIQAFAKEYLHYFDSEEALAVYIPLSWQEDILNALEEFKSQGNSISIQYLTYNKINNCLAVKAFKEIKQTEREEAQKAEKILNTLLAEYRKKSLLALHNGTQNSEELNSKENYKRKMAG